MPENLLEGMGRFVQRSLMKSLVRKEVMFAGWLRGVLSLTPPFGTGSNLSCWSSLLGNECCCVLLEVAAGCQGSPCSVLSTPSSVPAARTSLSSPGTAGTCPGLALALTCVLGDTFKPFSETERDHTAVWESLAGLPVPGLAEPGGLECCSSRASVSWNN